MHLNSFVGEELATPLLPVDHDQHVTHNESHSPQRAHRLELGTCGRQYVVDDQGTLAGFESPLDATFGAVGFWFLARIYERFFGGKGHGDAERQPGVGDGGDAIISQRSSRESEPFPDSLQGTRKGDDTSQVDVERRVPPILQAKLPEANSPDVDQQSGDFARARWPHRTANRRRAQTHASGRNAHQETGSLDALPELESTRQLHPPPSPPRRVLAVGVGEPGRRSVGDGVTVFGILVTVTGVVGVFVGGANVGVGLGEAVGRGDKVAVGELVNVRVGVAVAVAVEVAVGDGCSVVGVGVALAGGLPYIGFGTMYASTRLSGSSPLRRAADRNTM